MQAPPRLILFDLDGTLVDSQDAIVAALTYALDAHGLDVPERSRLLSIVGLSLTEAVRALLPKLDPPAAESVAAAYKARFAKNRAWPDHHEPMFPGALETIKRLAADPGTVLGLATGKSTRGALGLLERENIRDLFETVQTADTALSKPNPSMVVQAMRAVGADAGDTLMIGDTTYDIRMARNAGVLAIGVAWGYHPVADLERAGAHWIAPGFAELEARVGVSKRLVPTP